MKRRPTDPLQLLLINLQVIKSIGIGAMLGVTYAFCFDLDLTRHALLGAAGWFWFRIGHKVLRAFTEDEADNEPGRAEKPPGEEKS